MTMRVALVIPNCESSPLAISGASTIFRLAQSRGLPVEFQILSARRSKTIQFGYFSLTADERIQAALPVDLVVIPSITGDPEEAIRRNQPLIEWLRMQRTNRTRLVSLCTGAYLLAATGLLDGLEASSHCNAIQDLRQRFPEVQWVPEKIITDTRGIYTSGGTLSSFNVLIYVLAKYLDEEAAHHIARFIQLEYPRVSQKPFYIVSNQKNHMDEQILAVQNYLEKEAGHFVNLDDVAREFGLSRRSLNRRFKAATGDTPRTYMQRLKVEQVKKWLEREQLTISEAISRIGYSDENAFRNLFKRMTGMLPGEYQRRNRDFTGD